jgi:hypothetical protein
MTTEEFKASALILMMLTVLISLVAAIYLVVTG